MAHIDLFDTALRIAGVMAAAPAIGSGFGITAALLSKRPPGDIAMWGYWGTAFGGVGGLVLATVIVAVS